MLRLTRVALAHIVTRVEVDNLPAPAVIAAEIIEDLEAALAEFARIAESLGAGHEE